MLREGYSLLQNVSYLTREYFSSPVASIEEGP